MREFTKSVIRFSWSMSLFGMKQATNALFPPNVVMANGKSVRSLNDVSGTAQDQLGGIMGGMYKMGDRAQSSMVDLAWAAMTLQPLWSRKKKAEVEPEEMVEVADETA